MYEGDRVIVVDVRNMMNKNIHLGDKGTVIACDDKYTCLVEFDREIKNGHNADSLGRDGHCAYIRRNRVRRLLEEA